MFRPALRAATTARAAPKAQRIGRRFASTTPSRSGTWKGAAVRWTAAGAVVYYYNTSSVFAEEPQYAIHTPAETPQDSEYRTVDSIAERRRAQARSSQDRAPAQTGRADAAPDAENVAVGGPEALEEEAEQQGAFNEETGEINWDCPCLGGMAHGPCGDQFRAAFSCFVFSKEEPKGVECIEHFKTMQNCFRDHPEIYGSELDDEEVDAQLAAEGQQPRPDSAQETNADQTSIGGKDTAAATSQTISGSQSLDSAPKPWHDTRDSNAAK